MADGDLGKDGPSLELPTLGFGRRRRKQAPDQQDDATVDPQDDTAVESPTTILEADDLPQARPVDRPAERPADPPVERPAEAPVVPAATEPATTRTRPAAPTEAAAPPLFVDEVEPEPLPSPPQDGAHAVESPTRPRRTLPAIGGMAAAVVTGVMIGVITVGLTWGSLHLCEVVRGTSSCGGPGFLMLLAIMVAMIALGSLLLRAWGIPDPGSTSFLAVGLMAVLALLFLVDVLFSWWMILVIPLFSAATFALSHWVTTAFGEPADR